MSNYRLDAVGNPIRVGNRVAYSQPRHKNSGVSFGVGKVTRLLPKSVEIEYEREKKYDWEKSLITKKLEHVVLIPKFEVVDTMAKWEEKYAV